MANIRVHNLKEKLAKMQEGDRVDRFVSSNYLFEIDKAKIEDADFFVEVEKEVIDMLCDEGDIIVSSFIGEFCRVAELELKGGQSLLLVYLAPIGGL